MSVEDSCSVVAKDPRRLVMGESLFSKNAID